MLVSSPELISDIVFKEIYFKTAMRAIYGAVFKTIMEWAPALPLQI